MEKFVLMGLLFFALGTLDEAVAECYAPKTTCAEREIVFDRLVGGQTTRTIRNNGDYEMTSYSQFSQTNHKKTEGFELWSGRTLNAADGRQLVREDLVFPDGCRKGKSCKATLKKTVSSSAGGEPEVTITELIFKYSKSSDQWIGRILQVRREPSKKHLSGQSSTNRVDCQGL